MKFDIGRNHAQFNLNGGLNGSREDDYKRVVRAARDPVSVPTDPVIVAIATANLCRLGLGPNCFTLTNVYGVESEVPYGASLEDWKRIAADLLQQAMEEDAR